MKTVALKLAVLAALGVTLSGCIIYEGPDRGRFHHHHDEWSHHDDNRPAPDEKPAPVLDQSAASASASQSSQN